MVEEEDLESGEEKIDVDFCRPLALFVLRRPPSLMPESLPCALEVDLPA